MEKLPSLSNLLESERLSYRELNRSDIERVLRYANDESINRFLIFGDLAQAEGAAKYVARAVVDAHRIIAPLTAGCADSSESEWRRSFKLAVLLKPDGDFVGSCWLDVLDVGNSRATLGYFFDQAVWGQGLATEAVQTILKFGFETLQLHRIEATCDAEHIATQRVLEKAGLKREAVMRQNRQRASGWADSCLYAALK